MLFQNLLCHILSVRVCPAFEVGIEHWLPVFRMSGRWWVTFLAFPIVAFDMCCLFLLLLNASEVFLHLPLPYQLLLCHHLSLKVQLSHQKPLTLAVMSHYLLKFV